MFVLSAEFFLKNNTFLPRRLTGIDVSGVVERGVGRQEAKFQNLVMTIFYFVQKSVKFHNLVIHVSFAAENKKWSGPGFGITRRNCFF